MPVTLDLAAPTCAERLGIDDDNIEKWERARTRSATREMAASTH
jgi:hypothetical protein